MKAKVGHYPSQKYGWAKQERIILLDEYIQSIGNIRNKSVLDIGCGTGWLTSIVANNAKKVQGIDISEGMIKRALEENPKHNVSYRVMNALDIRKLNYRFDVVISALTMHSISPIEKLTTVLNNVKNVLKNKGKAVFLVPHPCFAHLNKRPYNTYTFRKEFRYFNKNQIYDVKLRNELGLNKFSCGFYTLSDYFNAFKDAGLRVLKIKEPEVPKKFKNKRELGWNLELKYPFYIIFELEKN